MIKIQTIIPMLTLACIAVVVSQAESQTTEIVDIKVNTHYFLDKQKISPRLLIEIEPEEEVIEVEPIEIVFESHKVDTLLQTVLIEADEHHICGCHPAPMRPIEITEDIIEEEEDYSLFAEPIYATPDLFEAIVFPNPTRDRSTLAIEINEEAVYQITLFDLNGRKIQEIHNGGLYEGRNQFDVEFYDLQSGIYLIQILSTNQNETLKIQKL